MWTLPNLLTLSRIVAVAPVMAAMWLGWWWIAAALFAAAAATDWLDGRIARTRGDVSELGRFLDPIADKIMVAAVLVALVAKDIVAGVTVAAVIAILLREIAVAGLREFLAPKGVVVHVSGLAKWKTAAQLVAGVLLLLSGAVGAARLPGTAALWIAAALTLWTGWEYLRGGMAHMRRA